MFSDFTRTHATQALVLFSAAAIALALASALGMQSPFWAAMPVWVVAQPWRQDLVLRAIFRFVGTVVGGLASWGLLIYVDGAFAQALSVAALIGVFTAAAFWIGTVYSYGAMMAAITVSVVVLPALGFGTDALEFAVERLWCTLIGVVSVTAISFAFTPKRAGPAPARVSPALSRVLKRASFAAFAGALSVAFAYLIGGPIGLVAGLSIAVFATLVGSSPHSPMILANLLPGTAIGAVGAVTYRLLASGFEIEGLALVALAIPFIAAGAILRSHPRAAPLGLDANMCFLLVAEAGARGHSTLIHFEGGVVMFLAAMTVTLVYGGTGHHRLMTLLGLRR